MGAAEKPSQPLTFQELPELRRKTEAISKFLQDQLLAHLETLRPVLSPARVFGQYAGSAGTKGDTSLAERGLCPAPAELQAVLHSPV